MSWSGRRGASVPGHVLVCVHVLFALFPSPPFLPRPFRSGKSYIAQSLRKEAERAGLSATVCSADDFFMRSGAYVFDTSLLTAAHEACMASAVAAVAAGTQLVVIDNTNSQRWEYQVRGLVPFPAHPLPPPPPHTHALSTLCARVPEMCHAAR